jgi:hypothetical protein
MVSRLALTAAKDVDVVEKTYTPPLLLAAPAVIVPDTVTLVERASNSTALFTVMFPVKLAEVSEIEAAITVSGAAPPPPCSPVSVSAPSVTAPATFVPIDPVIVRLCAVVVPNDTAVEFVLKTPIRPVVFVVPVILNAPPSWTTNAKNADALLTRVAVNAPNVAPLENVAICDMEGGGVSAFSVSVPLNVIGENILTAPIVQFAPEALVQLLDTVIEEALSSAAVIPLVNVVIVNAPAGEDGLL